MSESQTLVVKLGTSVLTGGSRRLNRAHIVELVRQCAQLHAMGHRIVIVTSGAIAAGREHLGYPELPATIASKQLLAAVGQSRLIQLWEQLFSIYGIHVGQMLLTRADMEDRERFLNARDTLRALLDNSIVPVINENDAVATAEIKVGDNDNLSALAAILAGADKLLLLTDQPGLFTADPRSNPQAELIKDVYGIDDALRAIAGDSVSGLGTGGMGTKLHAAPSALPALQNGPAKVEPVKAEQYDDEYLSLDLNVKVVADMDEAIAHIREHGTQHSDAILTRTLRNANRFINEVDSSAVYVNASTRFTDGGQFGLGAEVAVSTQKLHARGPMGLEALTTYKWIGFGDDTIRA